MNNFHETLRLFSLIWNHPGNQRHRVAAFLRFAHWQLKKRITGRAMIIETVGGRLFKIAPDSKFSSLVYYTKLPDWEEMQFLLHVLRAGDGFVDIGANVGFYTLLASARVRAENIWAVEPHPKNLEMLHEQLRINRLSGVKILPYALTDRDGVVSFTANERETGHVSSAAEASSFTVQARRLDQLLPVSALPKFTIAKMDVEGGEIDVLNGASELLASHAVSAWIIEVSQKNQMQRGRTVDQLLRLFLKNGYNFYRWNPASLELLKIDVENSGLENVIACWGEPARFTKRVD